MARVKPLGHLLTLALLGSASIFAPPLLWAQSLRTEVINLGFHSVSEIIPVIRPLVPPPGVVTGLQNKLIIKTTPENLSAIGELLKSLDRAPANLLISVRHRLDAEIQRDLASAAGQVRTDRVRVNTGERTNSSGAKVRVSTSKGDVSTTIQSSRKTSRQRDKQRIRVLEGRQAFIQAGSSVPYQEGITVVRGNTVTTVRTTQFRDVGTGFYVRPQLSGDHQVRLEISQHRSQLADTARNPPVRVSESSSSVSTALGRWTELAANARSSNTATSGLTAQRSIQRNSTQRVYVKVERVR